jgi:membrane protein YdbS with pleckstrin-like domain
VRSLPETQGLKPIMGLHEDEQVVWSGRPRRIGYLGTYIRTLVGGIIFMLVFGLPLLFEIWGWLFGFVMFLIIVGIGALVIEIRIRANKYFITNQRFLRDYTFISRHTETASMDLVTDINCDQGLIQRAVNCGNVFILTAGTPTGFRRGGFPGFRFEAVYDPLGISQIASKARMAHTHGSQAPPPPPPSGR